MSLKNLEELLAPKLGNNKIKKIDITKPPAKGIGSVMLKVKVILCSETGEEQLLHLVAKKIPASETLREGFDIQKTFKKEVAFYEVILPILREFQKEAGVTDVLNTFAEFYGARFSLEGKTEVVDDDAAMLLEDLDVRGKL